MLLVVFVLLDLLIWILLPIFLYKRIKQKIFIKSKLTWVALFLHLTSLIFLFAYFYFISNGIILKPLFYVSGLGVYLMTISLFIFIYSGFKNFGNRIVSIYLFLFSGFMLIINIILLSQPIAYFIKVATLGILFVEPIGSIEKIGNRLFIDEINFYTEGKREIFDKGWYYVKGEYFYKDDLKKLENFE
jgi:hypothetical protein